MYSLAIDLREDREEYNNKSIIRNSTPIMDAAEFYKRGEIDNAEKLLDQLLKIDPNDYLQWVCTPTKSDYQVALDNNIRGF